MVEEYAANGDLLQKIKRYGRINEDDSKFYFRQLIEALIVSQILSPYDLIVIFEKYR